MFHQHTTQTLDLLDPELWIITAADGPRRGGLVATFVVRASIVPELPRMLVGLSICHHTHDLVTAGGTLGMHLLREDQLDLVWRFGLQSGRDTDKFAGLETRTGQTGAPLLTDALAVLEGRVEARFATGDRTVHLVEIVDARTTADGPPLRMKQMLAAAHPEHRQELKRQLTADARRDAALIRAWRQHD